MEEETIHTYFLHISLKMSAEATSYMWFIYSDNRKIITNDEVIKLPANKSYTQEKDKIILNLIAFSKNNQKQK